MRVRGAKPTTLMLDAKGGTHSALCSGLNGLVDNNGASCVERSFCCLFKLAREKKSIFHVSNEEKSTNCFMSCDLRSDGLDEYNDAILLSTWLV